MSEIYTPLIELLVREEAKVNAICCSKRAFGEALQSSLSPVIIRAHLIRTKLQVASATTQIVHLRCTGSQCDGKHLDNTMELPDIRDTRIQAFCL